MHQHSKMHNKVIVQPCQRGFYFYTVIIKQFWVEKSRNEAVSNPSETQIPGNDVEFPALPGIPCIVPSLPILCDMEELCTKTLNSDGFQDYEGKFLIP